MIGASRSTGLWTVSTVAVAAIASACSTGAGAGSGNSVDASSGDGEPTDSFTASDSPADAAAAPTDGGVQGASDGFASGDSSQCSLPIEQAGVCNDVPLEGSAVTPTCVAAEPPTPGGGTIANGTYVLRSVVLYGACPSEGTFVTTWDICGNQWQVVQNDLEAGAPTLRVNFTADMGAASVTLTATCTANINEGTSMRSYTASGSQLQFIQLVEGATSVETYQRQ